MCFVSQSKCFPVSLKTSLQKALLIPYILIHFATQLPQWWAAAWKPEGREDSKEDEPHLSAPGTRETPRNASSGQQRLHPAGPCWPRGCWGLLPGLTAALTFPKKPGWGGGRGAAPGQRPQTPPPPSPSDQRHLQPRPPLPPPGALTNPFPASRRDSRPPASLKSQDRLTFLMLLVYCFIAIFSTVLSKPKKDLISKLADCSKQVQSSFSGWTCR